MTRFYQIALLLSFVFTLEGCASQKKEKYLQIGTGSRIDILGPRAQFYPNNIPAGWVIEGMDFDTAFSNRNKVANIFQARKEGMVGTHIQNGAKDFILARYTKAKMLVTPYLTWQWNVSEHKGEHHPVRLVVGFYGGGDKSPPLGNDAFIWRGEKLPPFDRLLAIGFDDMALKRGNLYSMGRVKYYAQRGGVEQTNMWYDEAIDLSLVYQRAWPRDDRSNVIVTFVGFAGQSSPSGGGITFSNIWLSR
ncbi:hypothetical protein MTBPR1_80102 [Candidatus Terasakiella magnetica]|uniref:Uncharacterized protein n=1 Tax=Candidatus Terasakiella magnetica TaxID=1867952 RepID=A0A1C3RLD2_9PROT|nr:hypothetical protein [Candidatus Terasakiella magnetica]SCA58048.1 hypothetical protein MTBPR1_80102 [Candidatus Terasakiella magnetica]